MLNKDNFEFMKPHNLHRASGTDRQELEPYSMRSKHFDGLESWISMIEGNRLRFIFIFHPRS